MNLSKNNIISRLWIISFIIMTITGFFPLIIGEKVLTGWWIILHATVAPLFALLMALVSLVYAKSMGIFFNKGWVKINNKYTKILFWLFLLLFIPNVLSILFSMNTWFVSVTQNVFLKVHFYSAIGMIFLILLHFNFLRKIEE